MTLAAIEDSRQQGGTLTLDGIAFAKQTTECALVPSVNSSGEAIEVLSGQSLSAEETYTWSLSLGYIQDFTAPAGLVLTLRANAGEEVPFAWTPNGDDGPSFTGVCKLRPVRIGGGVKVRLTDTVELPVISHVMAPEVP